MRGIVCLAQEKGNKMNKVVVASLQSWLIALGLLIMIPVTVGLGIDFFGPKVEWQTYTKLRNQHFQKCRLGKSESSVDYEKCNNEWRASHVEMQHLEQEKKRVKFEIMVVSPLVLGLIAVSSIIHVAIIAASFVGSAVLVHFIYGHSLIIADRATQEKWVLAVQLVLSLLSLALVLGCAHRDSKGLK